MRQSRELLFQMHKRGHTSSGKLTSIHLIALLLALVICAAVTTLVTGVDPLGVYETLVTGAVGNPRRFWVTMRENGILLLIAIRLTPAFHVHSWNIDTEGQILVDDVVNAGLAILLDGGLPSTLLLLLMPIYSMLFGMVWSLAPIYCKVCYHANEILFTLMMNYVASQLVAFTTCFWEDPKGSNSTGTINQATRAGWSPRIDGTGLIGNRYTFDPVIILLVAVLMHLYLTRTRQGSKIPMVGTSQNTARYVGISVQHVALRTVAISGAICGLADAVIVGGTGHALLISTTDGHDFIAVPVAWMTNFNPLFMAPTTVLLCFMQRGAIQIATQFKLNQNFSDIITRIVLLSLIGYEFFVRYQLTLRKRGAMK